jgi:hypothetical protein
VELARRRLGVGTVGLAVDHHAARATDAFAAVVVKGDRLLPVADQPLVEHVEHLEKRHVGGDVVDRIDLKSPARLGIGLPPDPERQ